ncbi:hypothetical protein [Planococcus halocryophilus]|uniref:Uncharacterized protein n=1 Tax=Planococcus halocryophilus TaxID=1215089 RepID=A0A1C7DM15_9BACL|nr:hypothetical protein [Planococcus halocryophilus]ANU12546.1 hypothetical protein BBI08_01155 [Planococcus halocryophilus]
MLTNPTNNNRILKLFRLSKRLVKSGNGKEAISYLEQAETLIRSSEISFYVRRATGNLHLQKFSHYGNKMYFKLFCLIHDLKNNIQNGLDKEALIKIEKIISSDMYADHIKNRIRLSDSKMELSPGFRKHTKETGEAQHDLIYLNLKGRAV